jgi:Fe-S cluster assembly protein SufD
MPTKRTSKDTVPNYLAAFERLERGRSHEPAWLRATRRSAMADFERLGFPTTRDEEWRFTNVTPIAENLFAPAPERHAATRDTIAPFVIPAPGGVVLVFVNGRFAPELSDCGDRDAASQVTARSLAAALSDDGAGLEEHLACHASFAQRPFTALNTAMFEDGAVVNVAANAVIEQPVQLLFLATAEAAPIVSHPRVLVLAGEHSQLRVVETFAGIGEARGFSNAVAEIVAGAGAVVDHYRVQRESGQAFHVGHTQLQLGRSSSASSHAVALGGLISRHDVVAVLADEGADCTLNGLYLADGRRTVDNHTEIDHAKPHGTSHELYKGILDDRSRAVFNGRIRVRPDAQKTDAKQTNKTLLLSDEAQINTKPQLEIFANDVKCTHGATVGQLNADALFYLRARGIGEDEARNMLIHAFAADVTNRMSFAPVRESLDRLLAERLPGALTVEALV